MIAMNPLRLTRGTLCKRHSPPHLPSRIGCSLRFHACGKFHAISGHVQGAHRVKGPPDSSAEPAHIAFSHAPAQVCRPGWKQWRASPVLSAVPGSPPPLMRPRCAAGPLRRPRCARCRRRARPRPSSRGCRTPCPRSPSSASATGGPVCVSCLCVLLVRGHILDILTPMPWLLARYG